MKQVHSKIQDKSALDVARLAARAAIAKKAEDVVILDLQGLSSFADYFVIMSGRSTRHTQGLAEAVEAGLRNKKVSAATTEGLREGFWVLLDYGDVVVHIFYHENRMFYDLEGLWHDAARVPLKEEAEAPDGEMKSTPAVPEAGARTAKPRRRPASRPRKSTMTEG